MLAALRTFMRRSDISREPARKALTRMFEPDPKTGSANILERDNAFHDDEVRADRGHARDRRFCCDLRFGLPGRRLQGWLRPALRWPFRWCSLRRPFRPHPSRTPPGLRPRQCLPALLLDRL